MTFSPLGKIYSIPWDTTAISDGSTYCIGVSDHEGILFHDKDSSNAVFTVDNCHDSDGDGYGTAGSINCQFPTVDCDDSNANVNPGMQEVCDGVDNDCDGVVDEEGSVGCSTYYLDADGDNYGLTSDSKCLCASSGSYDTQDNTDCDDSSSSVNPAASEVCSNGIDDNCNGVSDCAEGSCAGQTGPGGVQCCSADNDCSSSLPAVSQCDYSPDGLDYTSDSHAAEPYTCVSNVCTQPADYNPAGWTHSCADNDLNDGVPSSGLTCGAGCDQNIDCQDTACPNNECVGTRLMDSTGDVQNTCNSCSCTTNSCSTFMAGTDPDGDGIDTECGDLCPTVPDAVEIPSGPGNGWVEVKSYADGGCRHPGWTASIPGATWIWTSDPITDDLSVDVTKVFTDTFDVDDVVDTAVLDIAADNYYIVKLNGNEVCRETASENNFQTGTQDQCDLKPYIQQGTNTLEITATNKGMANGACTTNPAGLMYKITVSYDRQDGDGDGIGDACDVCPGDTGNDADSDGYCSGSTYSSPKLGVGDCDDSNPNINPGRVEDCLNTIDDNCNSIIDCDDGSCASDPVCVAPTCPASATPVLLESITLDDSNGIKTLAGVDTVNTLQAGKNYLIEASGTYQYTSSSGYMADVKYMTDDNWAGVTRKVFSTVIPTPVSELLLDKQSVMWGGYRSTDNHKYSYLHNQASAGKLNLMISDWYCPGGACVNDTWNCNNNNPVCMNDNTGSLDVNIYCCPTAEVCDSVDNDCDGQVDEGGVCAVCGNGVLEGAEECDDGNTAPGDGCSRECDNEINPTPGYDRPCGDGLDLCAWNTTLPLGNEYYDVWNCGNKYKTFWPIATDNTVACVFDGSQFAEYMLHISVDNDVVSCTLNDVDVPGTVNYAHEGCAPEDPRNGLNLNLSYSSGNNTLVCTVRDRPLPNGSIIPNANHFDACVTGSGTTSTTTTLPPCIQPPAGMVGWWPGDDTADDLIYDNDGVLLGSSTYAGGKVVRAFSLDGVDGYVNVGNPDQLKLTENVTLDAWIRVEGMDDGQVAAIAGKWGQTIPLDSYALALIQQGGVIKLAAGIGDGSTADDGLIGGAISPNTWTHVAMTYDRDTFENILYVNGENVASRFRDFGIHTSDVNFSIGVQSNVSTVWRFFPGRIDEVEVFSRALSEGEIKSIYNAGSLGKCKENVTTSSTTTTTVTTTTLPLEPSELYDYGDAPDSNNRLNDSMYAYGGVFAVFPTSYRCHFLSHEDHGLVANESTAFSHLGNAVTGEWAADTGPDQDGVTNIDPGLGLSDQDGGDDGLYMPINFQNCVPTSITVNVSIGNYSMSKLYLNVWFDWNRNGQWGDMSWCFAGPISDAPEFEPFAGAPAPEWAVQNYEILSGSTVSVQTIVTPSFLPKVLTNDSVWIRVSVAEAQQNSSDGDGPGYCYYEGETEDYYMPLVIASTTTTTTVSTSTTEPATSSTTVTSSTTIVTSSTTSTTLAPGGGPGAGIISTTLAPPTTIAPSTTLVPPTTIPTPTTLAPSTTLPAPPTTLSSPPSTIGLANPLEQANQLTTPTTLASGIPTGFLVLPQLGTGDLLFQWKLSLFLLMCLIATYFYNIMAIPFLSNRKGKRKNKLNGN